MSLRYASRLVYQGGMRVLQGMKDQASKCDSTAAIKSLRDSTTSSSSSSSSKQARRFSGATTLDSSTAVKAANNSQLDKLKQAEESLRTVMYLSCWAPN